MGSEVPIALAQSFVPTSYTLLPPNETFFPGITDGNVPLFLELGREANAGPPLLNFENFQEAKLEVPNVQRLSDSEIPFLYKRWIAVDNQLDVFGSLTDFGLNTSFNSFSPANSSNSTVYDYSIVSAIDATLEPLLEGENLRWPLETYERIGGMPWFAEYLTCAQHFYNWTAQDGTSFLRGNITLHPPYAGPGVFNPVTYPVQGINGVFEFKIVGPLICEEFV
ncbi:hypothetical protein HHX47_DHR10000322 [Lentinula edodes]|nr:hypothetical protein HHX47_DHR10000322 [Lentinula edodes]